MSRCDGVSKAIDPRTLKKQKDAVFEEEEVVDEEEREKERLKREEHDNPKDDPKIRVKRKCAAALLNMSLREQMETQFVTEGGLKSLLDLALSTADRETLTYCMSCILNLSGECRKDSRLFEFHIVQAINMLAESCDPKDSSGARIRQYVAKSLTYFTMLPDVEEKMVADGIIAPLTKLALHAPNPVTRMIAAKVSHTTGCVFCFNLTHSNPPPSNPTLPPNRAS